MFQFLKKKTKPTVRVGLMVQSDQLVLAHVERRNGSPYALRCKPMALELVKDVSAVLEDLVKELNLKGTQCRDVLNPKDYCCTWH